MIKQLLTGSIIGLSILLSTPAMAHNYTNTHNHDSQIIHPVNNDHQCVWNNNIGKRQAKQKKRIKQGIKSGQLTNWEVSQLKDQQYRIQRAKRGMLQSGNCLSRVEIGRLNHMLNDGDRYIRSLKNNDIRVRNNSHNHHHNHGGHHNSYR